MSLVNVSVSVPEESVGQLLRYAATLADGTAPEVEADYNGEENEDGPQRARRGSGRGAVRKAYLGGVSQSWRPFLEHLAEQPAQWVPWSELCEAVGLEPGSAAGMLGAAERRCGRTLPYEKRRQGSRLEFRMDATAAKHIRELAAQQDDGDYYYEE